MIYARMEDLQEVCSILSRLAQPVASNVVSQTLEVRTVNGELEFVVADTNFNLCTKVAKVTEDIHAVVSASEFLSLMSKITTESVGFEIDTATNSLNVNANGNYKFPLLMKDDNLLVVPEMKMDSILNTWSMSGDALASIEQYNLSICTSTVITSPLNRYVYLDGEGSVSYSTRACINNFTSAVPIKLLAPIFLVKTFPLYKGKDVTVTFGYANISSDLIQNRIILETDRFVCTYALPFTDEQINEFPAQDVRDLANDVFNYSTVVSTKSFLEAIDRLLIFKSEIMKYAKLDFKKDHVDIRVDQAKEELYYDAPIEGLESYEAEVDLEDLKAALGGDKFTGIHFGNDSGIALVYGNISNIISVEED